MLTFAKIWLGLVALVVVATLGFILVTAFLTNWTACLGVAGFIAFIVITVLALDKWITSY